MAMDMEASFGAWVKLRRRALRLTQDELARLVGCSCELIRKIEADARRPSIAIAERLAIFLDLPAQRRDVFVKVARAELRTEALPRPDLLVAAPPAAGSGARPFSLPTPLTSLIGRARELTNLRACLQRTDVRLLTLTGAPGIGKTRLAIQAAADIGEAFADGVCFVALAPVSDSTAVAAAIAQALGLQERPDQSTVESLKEYLRDRQLLLVLDNFEHLLAAASLSVDLLMGAPAVKILVTSRATLRISGEHEFVVSPLALPNQDSIPAVDGLARYAAIDLFVQRARVIKPDFVLTRANAPAIASICVRLDGLPLAIELASARIKFFPPEILLARLERRLAFLTVGPRDLPMRQQTLRNTIDWSYDLLDSGEQMLFMRLGVFVGGCTLAAAEAVCDVTRDHPTDVLDGLASLVDKSLLQQEEATAGESRLVMLETLREYALERLEQSGEADALRQLHAEYYLGLVEAAEPAFRGPQAREWMDRLTADYDNVRAALTWSLAAPDRAECGLRLAGALWWFWDKRSLIEGETWLTRMLSRSQARVPAAARAKALTAASFFAWMQGAPDQALVFGQQALALAREAGDQVRIAWAIHQLGHVLVLSDDVLGGAPLLEQSLTLFRANGDRLGIARSLLSLGEVELRRSDVACAKAFIEESLALSRGLGDMLGTADPLVHLGNMAWTRGATTHAIAFYDESLALYREAGDRWGVALALGNLGIAAIEQGDFAHAAALLAESMTNFRVLGAKAFIAWAHTNLGDLERARGDDARAAGCYNESLTHFQELGDEYGAARVRCNLGLVAHRQHNAVRAIALFMECLRSFQRMGATADLAAVFAALAAIAAERRQPDRAATLFGAAEALHKMKGRTLPPALHTVYDADIAAVRTQLSEATFRAAWAEGQAMSLEQLIADALQLEAAVA
jgi:predicted ATPase/transcriptional regulator with XRE-family HTH domain